jgi:hypothetical protein
MRKFESATPAARRLSFDVDIYNNLIVENEDDDGKQVKELLWEYLNAI